HQSGLLQRQQVDLVRAERLQHGERDFRVVGQRARLEAALGQPTLQRHLAALEADLVKTTGARLLTLVATSGRLAEPGADAPAHAATRATRAIGRLDAVEFHVAFLGEPALRAPSPGTKSC